MGCYFQWYCSTTHTKANFLFLFSNTGVHICFFHRAAKVTHSLMVWLYILHFFSNNKVFFLKFSLLQCQMVAMCSPTSCVVSSVHSKRCPVSVFLWLFAECTHNLWQGLCLHHWLDIAMLWLYKQQSILNYGCAAQDRIFTIRLRELQL